MKIWWRLLPIAEKEDDVPVIKDQDHPPRRWIWNASALLFDLSSAQVYCNSPRSPRTRLE